MDSFPIYTALKLPTVTSHPSLTCLQWSAEGQLCFVAKNAAYILTPEHGITHDNASVIRGSQGKDSANDRLDVGWFRTIIQFDSGEAFKWPEHSQDWGAVSLGSMDLTLRAIAVSPSNLSSNSGCVIAALSSNMDLTLWTATRNPLKGEWVKVFDATPSLIEKSRISSPESNRTAHALRAQVVCMCWTPGADFGVLPVPICNGSLLICGNRAGSILFLRYSQDSLELVHDLPLSEQWITNVAFQNWVCIEPGTASGTLAYGTASGSVGLARVTQTLVEREGPSLFGSTHSIETVVLDLGLVYEPDKASIASLRWIVPHIHSPILVFSKPGKLWFWSASSETPSWHGLRSLNLRTQPTHKSSSAYHPVTGLNCVSDKDILIATLSDGSFHVVRGVSVDPSWSNADITSEQLSTLARSVFVKTEDGDVDLMDANRITGAVLFDNSSTLVWAQELARPSDFSYKHEAKHSSTLIVGQLWEHGENADDLLLEKLAHLLATVKAAAGRGPLDLLRPYFFRLSNESRLNQLHPRVLQVLQVLPGDHSLSINISPCTVTLSEEVRKRFRMSLSRHLFGYDAFVALRMRLSLADFTWKLSDTEEKRHECGLVAQSLLNAISHRSLRTIIRHLKAAVSILQANDAPFVMRTVVQSLLPGSPPDLSAEAQALSALVQATMPGQASGPGGLPQIADEHCPACGAVVPLRDITTAVCTNLHAWTRCSITTFILSTPHVRTCIGCGRKAFLPLSSRMSETETNWLPPLARGWVVEELLEAVPRCLFCNNNFVRVI